MEVDSTETSTVAEGLVAALEQATLMAKQLAKAADPSHLLQIHTALHSAHHHLSLFISHHPQFPPPPPQPPMLPTPPPENSVSSAVGGGGDGDGDENDEPMQMGDDEDEQNSRAATVERVEERMRECFIQNKRPKRRLSPSAEQRRGFESEAVRGGSVAAELDPVGTKLRSLDLIYQFHAVLEFGFCPAIKTT